MKKLIAVAIMLASGVASANDTLLVTGEKAKGGTVIALDYASSGAASGVQFKIAVPGGEKAKVNLSGCLKALPSSHGGACSFAKGMVIGIVYSDSNALLPAGMLSFGTIGVSGGAAGSPEVVEFIAADAQANKIASNVELGSDAVVNKLNQAQ
jgi:hypothetical protein